jgi:HlyD family secretion protein
MRNKKVWIGLVALIVLLGAGFYFRTNIIGLVTGQSGNRFRAQGQGQGQGSGFFDPANLTMIQPGNRAGQVSAAGNIALISQRSVVLQAGGAITQVPVKVGDVVAAGDLLVSLDTTDLQRSVDQAKLTLANAQVALDKLKEPADPAEIAAARASLASAQQQLATAQAGATPAQLQAAQAKLAAAQAAYQDLKNGPSDAELTQLSADLDTKLITLRDAQAAYDKVAYKGDAGSSSQASALQTATIAYNASKAAYEIAVKPAAEADLQTALGNIQSAQDALDTLRNQSKTALPAAQAQVASAQSALDTLLKGPTDTDLKAAEISVQQAQLSLDAAQATLAQAQLRAPMAGTLLSVDVAVGQQVSAGTSAVTMADLSQLELTINVAEVDVGKIRLGQKAEVTLDALPDKTFTGTVSVIAPSSAATSGVVNYPVTIQLDPTGLEGVRPGMTSMANLLGDVAADTWLVPTSALVDQGGNSVVMIVRGGRRTPITVTRQGSQGEWTIVQSPELQKGDQAIGSVSSYLQQNTNRFGAPGGIPGIGGGGVRRPGD